MPLILAIIGERGSGKETFAQTLQEIAPFSIEHIRFSDILQKTLKEWNIPTARENFQKLAASMNHTFGGDSVLRATLHQITNKKSQIIILDGMRWPMELEGVSRMPNHLIVYVTASPQTRFARMKGRNDKAGENKVSLETFLEGEKMENEIHIPIMGQKAPIRMVNETDVQTFKEEIKRVWESQIQPRLST